MGHFQWFFVCLPEGNIYIIYIYRASSWWTFLKYVCIIMCWRNIKNVRAKHSKNPTIVDVVSRLLVVHPEHPSEWSTGCDRRVPSGNLTYGKSPFLMGKSTISMAIFNSYVKLPEGVVEPFQSWGHVCSPRPSISFRDQFLGIGIGSPSGDFLSLPWSTEEFYGLKHVIFAMRIVMNGPFFLRIFLWDPLPMA